MKEFTKTTTQKEYVVYFDDYGYYAGFHWIFTDNILEAKRYKKLDSAQIRSRWGKNYYGNSTISEIETKNTHIKSIEIKKTIK